MAEIYLAVRYLAGQTVYNMKVQRCSPCSFGLPDLLAGVSCGVRGLQVIFIYVKIKVTMVGNWSKFYDLLLQVAFISLFTFVQDISQNHSLTGR